MAEKSPEACPSSTTPSEGSGNWWDSWLTSAKTKSAEVYSMVRKDLDEIGTAVKSEASHVLNSTTNVIGKTLKLDVPESPANVMKKSFSTFIGQVSTALSPQLDDDDDTEVILSSGDTTMLSTYKKELEALQRVDATFLVEAASGEFVAWRASLEPAGDAVISAPAAARRLQNNPLLREQYQRLVPAAVTHEEFWERYLFRVAVLQDRLAAAARKVPPEPTEDPVMQHLPLHTPAPGSPKKESISSESVDSPYESPDIETVAWDEEDFAPDVELTEEQQTLLLEEYEKEIVSKKQLSKQTSSRDIANNNTDEKTTNTPVTKINTMKSSKGSKTPAKTNSTNKTNTAGKSKLKANTKAAKKSPAKGKTDVCGNNLVEDYFGENQAKDDASANSDESWEKEFEIDETDKVTSA